ncbi:hypothetical protein D3C78_1160340 [compost metagenome]
MVGQFQRRGAAGVGNRDNHVDVVVRTLAQDLLGQLLAHAQARLVDRDAVHDGVRARQVDVLENAGSVLRVGSALAGEQLAFLGDVHRFARRQVADQGEAEHIEGNAFGGDHVLHAFVGMTLAEDDRANAVRVTEANDAVAGDHRHHRITTYTAVVHVSDRSEHVFFGRLQLAAHRQLVGEDVEQDFRVGTGVDVAQVGLVDLLGQLFNVGQVAVVRQGDAVWRVDVERLSLGRGRAARSRVTHMADPHVSDQALHMALLEHITDQTVVLAQE